MSRITLLFVFLCLTTSLGAQDFGYGFKAGLNFNRIIGPSEETPQGESLEEMVNSSGFHVGAIFNLKFNSSFGARAELLYSQKGGRVRYNGPSYYTIYTTNAEPIATTGNRQSTLNNNLSYIDIPLGVYYKPAKWLEFSAGANIGILGGATGAGQVSYSGVTADGGQVPEFSVTLEYDYYRNETGQATFGIGSTSFEVDGEDIEIPARAGAYYEYPREDGSYFNLLDYGLYGGMSLFMNKGFFLGLRLNYGLADITNDSYDYSKLSRAPNGDLISREDNDQNLSFQVSLGFSF